MNPVTHSSCTSNEWATFPSQNNVRLFLCSSGTNYHSNLFKSDGKLSARRYLASIRKKSFVVVVIHNARMLYQRGKKNIISDFRASYLWQKRRTFDDMKIIRGCRWIPKWNLAYQLWSPAAPWPRVRMRRVAVQSAFTSEHRQHCDQDETSKYWSGHLKVNYFGLL